MSAALAMLVALALDALIGWPDAIYRRIGHPVTWLGALISWLEHRLNDRQASDRYRFFSGSFTTVGVIGVAVFAAALLQCLLPGGVIGIVVMGILAWPLVAARSMYAHVLAVLRPVQVDDLAAARGAVSMIVGRDPAQLNMTGVTRAALESLAENSSDGIVAPVFWGALLGLPGIAAYKAINTLDSMIGHRNERYEYFGKLAARIDDVVNLIPARITGALFALVSSRPISSLRCVWRDAHHHRSPNAGWPEAALAGALNVRLSGPRSYGDSISNEPWVNGDSPDPTAKDLFRGLRLYLRAMVALAGCLGLWAYVIGGV